MSKKKFRKFVAVLLVQLLLWRELMIPSIVLAQEILEPTGTTTNEQSETVPPAEVISTGNATATTESTNIVNGTETTAPGNASGCVISGGCEGTNDRNNTADLGTSNASTASTGENLSIADSSAVTIETGTAVAITDNTNRVNNSLTTLDENLPSGTSPESTTNTENVAEVVTSNSANSVSGANSSGGENNTEVKISTGEAVAFANVVNLINTNVTGSQLGIYFYNNFGGDLSNLDLNQVWKNIQTNESGGVIKIQEGLIGADANLVVISNKNMALVNNQVTVVANTGDNSISGSSENALILTGNATALANVINLINANLVGSKFFIGVINLSANSLGDLVLPRPDLVANQNTSCDNCTGQTQNNNQVTLTSNVNSTANSGANQTSGGAGGMIMTGNASSYANNFTTANLDLVGGGQMFLTVNVLGQAGGKIYNWQFPGSSEEWVDGQKFFSYIYSSTSQVSSGQDFLQNDNLATLNNNIKVTANTGGNRIEGATYSDIISGRASAVANLTNLVNMNIFGSNWFFGIINIVGNWNGNTVFAYPDVAVEISSESKEVPVGSEIKYLVKYSNLGYEEAGRTVMEIQLPSGVEYLSDDSGLPLTRIGNKLTWTFEKMGAMVQHYFEVRVRVTDIRTAKLPFWKMIVKTAYAAENISKSEVETVVTIKTTSLESDVNNNSSSIKTITFVKNEVVETKSSDTSTKSTDTKRFPKLEITAANNVNKYVFPGDIVTFEITIDNKGEGIAKNNVLVHEIYDDNNQLWKKDEIFLGDLEAGTGGKLSFGVIIDLPLYGNNGARKLFYTKSRLEADDDYGNRVSSNEVQTGFGVQFSTMKRTDIQAVDKSSGEVLGTKEAVCLPEENIVPYLLLFLVSGFWLQKQTVYWLQKLKK
ncbi:hypothetical protein HYV64_01305 [Candidatus Shapirobacteria bacterium]|nr:hypothetical protein [Candidatus Shapirobacteria bacterium]